jgi:hypothetical protein
MPSWLWRENNKQFGVHHKHLPARISWHDVDTKYIL